MKALRVQIAHILEASTIFDLVEQPAQLSTFALEQVEVCHVATSFRRVARHTLAVYYWNQIAIVDIWRPNGAS